MKRATGIVLASIFLAISSAFAGGKTVHVHAYYRSDGTYVHAYDRAARGTASSTASSSSLSTYRSTGTAPAVTQQRSDETYAESQGFRSAEQYRKWRETGRLAIPAEAAATHHVGSTGTTPRSYNEVPYVSRYAASPSLGVQRDAHGRIKRSEAAKHEFMQVTGYAHGRAGYVVDHVIPLKHGGCDCPSNMQWQTIQEAKAKDKWE